MKTIPPAPAPETRGQAETRRRRAHLALMHARHGTAPETCGTCASLVRVQHGGTGALKCGRFGVTRSEASDWRVRWPACGLWRAKERP